MTPTTQVPIDRTLWQPLLEVATREVFEMMVGTCIEKASNDLHVPFEFTAMVGLAGQLCGVLSVRGSHACAVSIASKMLGIPMEEAGKESFDAVAEVCNMVAGNFKAKLSGIGDQCLLSVPTVVTGADYQLRSLANGEVLENIVMFDGHPISIILELHT